MAVLSKDLSKEFPYTENCELLSQQIELLIINKDYWSRQFNNFEASATDNFLLAKKKWYDVYGCISKIESLKQKNVKNVLDNFNKIDEERIELKTDADVKKRIIIGGSVLVLGLFMIIFLSKKK